MKKLLLIFLLLLPLLLWLPHEVSAEEQGTKITITPFGKGFENWENSPNCGEEYAVTQLVFSVTKDGVPFDIPEELHWRITLDAFTQLKVINLDPATKTETENICLYRFEPCLGQGENYYVPPQWSHIVIVEIFDGDERVYYSDPTQGFWCNVEPVIPGVGVGVQTGLDIEVPEVAFVNDHIGEIGYTALQVMAYDRLGDPLFTKPDYYTWYMTWQVTGSHSNTRKKATISPIAIKDGLMSFNLTQSGIFLEKGVDYTISLTAKTPEGNVFYQTNPTGGFVCNVDVFPQPSTVAVIPYPAERTFTSNGTVSTYLENAPETPELVWDLLFTSVLDPQKSMSLSLSPTGITADGLYTFLLPEETSVPFSFGEELTLTVTAFDQETQTTYRSEAAEGYFFDPDIPSDIPEELPENIPENIPDEIPENIPPSPITAPQNQNEKEISPLYFLIPFVIIALVSATFFTLQEKKR